jgi:hypothetical protein
MKSGDLQGDLFELILKWDVPALRRRPDAQALLGVMELSPFYFSERETPEFSDSTVDQMALGILLELKGESDQAKGIYRRLSEQPALEGLMGRLLVAWMAGASEQDIDDVEQFASQLALKPDLRARIFCKLMTWSRVHGWYDRARYYYREAVKLARGDLRLALMGQGSWFGEQQTLLLRPIRSRLVRYPWLEDAVDRTVSRAFEERTKNISRRSQRVWRLGGSEGSEVTSAELQADWAGAHWLLPEFWRTHAALILERSEDLREDIARAIGLWARGGGDITGLVDEYEGLFDENTADFLLHNQLNGGASAKDRASWIRACSALWDQLSEELARQLIREIEIEEDRFESLSQLARDSIALFTVLAVRLPDEWAARYGQLNSTLKSLVTTFMAPSVARRLPQPIQVEAASAFLTSDSRLSEYWSTAGWATVASIVDRTRDAQLRMIFTSKVPKVAVSLIALDYPGLLPREVVTNRISELRTELEQQLEEMQRGAYSMGGEDPSIAAMRCMVGLRNIDEDVLGLILRTANARLARAIQSTEAVRALCLGVSRGLLTEQDVAPAIEYRGGRPSLRFWNEAVDVRMENLQRDVLASYFGDDRRQGGIIDGARDTDSNVRRSALRAVIDLAKRGRTSLFDACILGALYDPDSYVQEVAVRAVNQRLVGEPVIAEHCQRRLLQMWPDANRSVRATIASDLEATDAGSAVYGELRRRAVSDRSAMVRLAVSE